LGHLFRKRHNARFGWTEGRKIGNIRVEREALHGLLAIRIGATDDRLYLRRSRDSSSTLRAQTRQMIVFRLEPQWVLAWRSTAAELKHGFTCSISSAQRSHDHAVIGRAADPTLSGRWLGKARKVSTSADYRFGRISPRRL
jgi:hypothetical protein